MAWTAPRTWVTGEVVTSSLMNTHVRDNLNALWYEWYYGEVTTTVSASGGGTADVITSGALTYVAKPIVIEFRSKLAVDTNVGGNIQLNLYDSTTDLGIVGSYNASIVAYFAIKLTPSAASHTYKVKMTGNGNSQSCSAGAGGAGTQMPISLRIIQQGSA